MKLNWKSILMMWNSIGSWLKLVRVSREYNKIFIDTFFDKLEECRRPKPGTKLVVFAVFELEGPVRIKTQSFTVYLVFTHPHPMYIWREHFYHNQLLCKKSVEKQFFDKLLSSTKNVCLSCVVALLFSEVRLKNIYYLIV